MFNIKNMLVLMGMVITGGMYWNAGEKNTGAPPYVIEDLEPPEENEYSWFENWVRPDGPVRVGLQAGHWKNSELPEELDRLIGSTGSTGGGKTEWEVNLKIAEETKNILEKYGVEVDILPATVPKRYWADVFVSIHADGNKNTTLTGYKAAHSRRDFSGKADELVEMVEKSYETQTKMVKDDNISRNMTGYYAFAWWRYEHSVHPKTPAIIMETGFLTSPNDRKIIANKPELSAVGIAEGILNYLRSEKLLKSE